ncbi:MAG TPA: flavin reductase family protein [Terracidiphilus sp.]|nr:flavin reductase family protein [Terracidiphilus sp.]
MTNTETNLAAHVMEPRQFRRVCSRFASGVTIISVIDSSGVPHGMTASSFTSVSLNPPLILICVNSGTRFLEACNSAEHFGVNVLGEAQRALSERFAGSGYDRFDGVTWNPGATGVPLFPGVLATMECARYGSYIAGDHEILIGKVLHATWREGEPLIHFGSQYRALESSPSWWSTI